MNPNIGENNQPALLISAGVAKAPQALQLHVVQKIVAETALNRTGPNRTLSQVIRVGVYGMTTAFSVIFGTSDSQIYGGLWSPRIVNKWQYTSPYFNKSDGLDAVVDGNVTNNPVVPPVLTQVSSDKISDSSSRYIYA